MGDTAQPTLHHRPLEVALFIAINFFGLAFILLYFFSGKTLFVIISGIVFVVLSGAGLFITIVAKMWQHEVHEIMQTMYIADASSSKKK